MNNNSGSSEASVPKAFHTSVESFAQYRFCAASPPLCAYSEAEWRSVPKDNRHWHRQMNPYPFPYFSTLPEAARVYLLWQPRPPQIAAAYCALPVHTKAKGLSRSSYHLQWLC